MTGDAVATATSPSTRVLLVLSLSVGLILGQSPLAIVVDFDWVTIVVALLSVAMAGVIAIRSQTVRTERVLPEEWLITSGNATFTGLTVAIMSGFLGLTWYGAIWLVNLTPWVEWPATSVARWVAVGMWLVFVFLQYPDLRTDAERLLPSESSGHSVFSAMVQNRWNWWIGAAALILVLAISIARLGTSNWTALIWFLGLSVWAASSAPPSQVEYESSDEYAAAVNQFGKALTAHGYDVVSSPETGDAETDEFLEVIDLYASSESGAVVVDIRLKSPKIGWEVASEGVSASTMIQGWQTIDESANMAESWDVQPVLVLLDTQPGDGLDNFCLEFGVGLVVVDTAYGDSTCSGRSDLPDVVDAFLGGMRAWSGVTT